MTGKIAVFSWIFQARPILFLQTTRKDVDHPRRHIHVCSFSNLKPEIALSVNLKKNTKIWWEIVGLPVLTRKRFFQTVCSCSVQQEVFLTELSFFTIRIMHVTKLNCVYRGLYYLKWNVNFRVFFLLHSKTARFSLQNHS